MQLNFSDYSLLNLRENTLLVSPCGAIKITSTKLKAALTELQSRGKTSIDDGRLNKILRTNKLPLRSTKLFLESTINLKAKPSEPYYKKILILHDWPEENELERIAEQELNSEYKFIYDNDALIEEANKEPQFIKIITTQYNYKKIKTLYFKLTHLAPTSAISVSYVGGNIFHIGQPHINDLGNPCHFCAIDRQLNYERRNASKNSWTKLMRFCQDHDITTPSQRLNLLQRNLAAGAIIRKIRFHTEHDVGRCFQDNVISSTVVNLNTGALIEEIIPHWHSCDCLRPSI